MRKEKESLKERTEQFKPHKIYSKVGTSLSPRFEVYLDPRWKQLLEKLLKDPDIKHKLAVRNFKEDASGVVKLAVSEFLEDMNKNRKAHTHTNSKVA